METKNKSLFDGKHRYVSETALVCSCFYKKRFVVTCLLFNSSSAHLCRYFLLLMTAAAAALPVWRLQLKVCVSSEGPLPSRGALQAPVAAGSVVITPPPKNPPLTGSYIG